MEENAEVTNVESEVIKEPEEKIEEPLQIKEEVTTSLWQSEEESLERTKKLTALDEYFRFNRYNNTSCIYR